MPWCLQDLDGIPELQVDKKHKKKKKRVKHVDSQDFFGIQVANIRSGLKYSKNRLHLQRQCSPKLCKAVQMVPMSQQ